HNSLRFYADLYQPACNLIKGDKSPNYYMLPQEQIRFIYNIMPDVKIIFMLRNPIDRAWSHAMMNLVKLPQRSFESVSREAFLNHFVRTQPKGDYFTALNNWRAIFPTENIMVGFYEQIRQAPFKLLEATFTHIGAPLNVNWDSFSVAQKINRGPGQSMDPFYRATLTEMFTDEIKALETEFGAQVSHWLQQ
ncbi:MAG: sulfotransferase, partial [Anaerolineales bacterium]|nr:sulfotransferase [Anaerolineales bacterium]